MADAEQIIEWLKLAEAATEKQLERENEDLAFQTPEGQWDSESANNRGATTYTSATGASITIPPRPMISVATLEEPIALVTSQFDKAHLGVQIHPLTEDASDDTAEILQGLYRRIEVDSRANLARAWAYDRAVKAGRGCYRVFIVPDVDSDVPGDMKIAVQRVLYQSAVYSDPFAQEPDDSDAQWWIIIEDMPLTKYKRLYKDSKAAKMGDSELVADGAATPGWIGGDTPESRTVRVAEAFYLEHSETTVKGKTWKGEESSVAQTTSTVKHCTVNAFETLEEEDWLGRYIPMVRTIGKELQPYDTGDGLTRQWFGMIAPAKGGARLTNYAASGAIEMAALEPKAPWMAEEGVTEGYEDEYRLSNIRNIPVLHFRSRNLMNDRAEKPSRVQVDVSRLGPNMQLLSLGQQFVQTATAIHPPSLGIDTPAHRSGKAIQALQSQSMESNSPYLVNFAQMSMTQEARIVLDLVPHVYDRPGRIARILGEDGKTKRVMLNQPFMPTPDGRLQGLSPTDPRVQQQAQDPKNPVTHYDLSKGRYGVSVTIGKSYTDKMAEGTSEMGAILQADPALMAVLGPEYFLYRGEPWAEKTAKILEKVRAHQMPWLDETAQPDAAAELAKAQQQLQQLGQVAEQMKKQLDTDAAAQAAKVEIEKIKAQVDLKLQEMKNAATIAVAEINARAKTGLIGHELEMEAAALNKQIAANAMEADAARQHELELGNQDRAHQVGMASAGAVTDAQTAEAEAARAAQAAQMEQPQQAQAAPEAAV